MLLIWELRNRQRFRWSQRDPTSESVRCLLCGVQNCKCNFADCFRRRNCDWSIVWGGWRGSDDLFRSAAGKHGRCPHCCISCVGADHQLTWRSSEDKPERVHRVHFSKCLHIDCKLIASVQCVCRELYADPERHRLGRQLCTCLLSQAGQRLKVTLAQEQRLRSHCGLL